MSKEKESKQRFGDRLLSISQEQILNLFNLLYHRKRKKSRRKSMEQKIIASRYIKEILTIPDIMEMYLRKEYQNAVL